MLTRQPALVHACLQLGCRRSLVRTAHRSTGVPGRPAHRPGIDCFRIDTRTLRGQLPQPLVQIDLACLQEPLQPCHVGQQHRHRDLVHHRHIRVGNPAEPVERGNACHTPSRN
jgi:hypothetical protein